MQNKNVRCGEKRDNKKLQDAAQRTHSFFYFLFQRRVRLCRAEEKAAGLRLELSWGGNPSEGRSGWGLASRFRSCGNRQRRFGFGQLPTEVRVEWKCSSVGQQLPKQLWNRSWSPLSSAAAAQEWVVMKLVRCVVKVLALAADLWASLRTATDAFNNYAKSALGWLKQRYNSMDVK